MKHLNASQIFKVKVNLYGSELGFWHTCYGKSVAETIKVTNGKLWLKEVEMIHSTDEIPPPEWRCIGGINNCKVAKAVDYYGDDKFDELLIFH